MTVSVVDVLEMVYVTDRNAHSGGKAAAHYLCDRISHSAAPVEESCQMVMLCNHLELAVVLGKFSLGRELVTRKYIQDDYQRKEYRNNVDYLESDRHPARKRLDRIVRDMP